MKKRPMLTPDNAIEKAGNLISHSKRIVAFTGAGISTDSGIPDLSGIDRILKDDPYFTGDVFNLLSSSFATHHPEEFYRLYRKTFFFNQMPNQMKPTIS
ncbi:Sir2 family NAD-dependent protein deacetylase [Lentilactobacillus kisonensis]|uniref:Sir2 family NAD-dependent protein deacetylase n=1 Tax=Lentilactobacillus kisonensis TaxID=481722 RepID=UPI000A8901B8|nr:Sir2 family NAD-dependent protein deacetylase [Lentilactobacillus kisonensis]